MQSKKKTSWEPVSKWYKDTVGKEGHYYHQSVIFPRLLKIFGKVDSLLDIACGQGVLAGHLSKEITYEGVDISPSLIKAAKQQHKQEKRQFHVGDATKPLPVSKKDFSHATIILAIQNIADPLKAFKNAYAHLKAGGLFFIVLNHPCFRIPRQSSWGIDENKKLQYRRVDRYQTSMEIPIQAHPGQGDKSPETVSFHHPLMNFTQWLFEAGFVIEVIEEWCSDKVSTGSAAKMENRSRDEIPMFMTIRARKL